MSHDLDTESKRINRQALGETNSRHIGDSGERKMASRNLRASIQVVNSATNVLVCRGAGKSLKLAEVITANVPWLPISNFIMSYPATFLTTRPPPFALRPSPVTKRTPRQKSRNPP